MIYQNNSLTAVGFLVGSAVGFLVGSEVGFWSQCQEKGVLEFRSKNSSSG
jgi:hypothetical protein